MPLFECRGLTRRPFFEGKHLVLEAGEIVVLSGPSGSGKSLFLRALADLDPAEAGQVFLDGEERNESLPSTWRARVLYVHPGGVRLTGTAEDNLEAVRRLDVRAPGVGPFAPEDVLGVAPDAPADRLSSGEGQSLALHRALACEPRVLLLDEPTAALHAEAATVWEQRLTAWARDGHAALWISHEAGLAQRLGARLELFP